MYEGTAQPLKYDKDMVFLLFQGIAKKLVKAALLNAARKREMYYSHLIKINKGVRRHFHDDITVVVLYLDYGTSVSLRCELEN